MYKELASIANELDRRGLAKEASRVDLFLKLAQATGRNSALKIILKEVLENSGYSVSDNPGEADIHLNTKSNSWGNLNEAWFTFAKDVLKIEEVATQWTEVAAKIGTGYKPTRSGMMDLLQDFTQGGRAQVGANLGTLGRGGLAEQTEARKKSIEDQRAVNTALEPIGDAVTEMTGEDSRHNRGHDLRRTREEAEAQALAAAEAKRPDLIEPNWDAKKSEESGSNAYTPE
jgi:hypothetical protein